MTKAKRSLLHHIYGKESTESHLVNQPKGSIRKSTLRSRLGVSSHQTPIRRSARILSSEKLKSEISSQLSAFYEKSVEPHSGYSSIFSKSKRNASYKMTRRGLSVKNQLVFSRSNFTGESRIGCRRSPRFASETRTISFESQIPCVNRRQSLRVLGISPISSENVKKGIKNFKACNVVAFDKLLEEDCNIVNSPILRRSIRLVSVAARAGKEPNEPESIKSKPEKSCINGCASTSSLNRMSSHRLRTMHNEVKKEGEALNITDKEEGVSERLIADRVDLILKRKIGDVFLNIDTKEIHKKKRECGEDNVVDNTIEKKENADLNFTVAWTKEQEEALQKAYLMSKPSPHFWKKVSRMVPGKSAQDCFDKIHSSIATPLPSQHRSKARRKSLSPICNFTLSGTISPQISKLAAGRIRRTKKLAAQKIVRHLLRKHRLTDQEKTFDRFSLLESRPMHIMSNVPGIPSPETSCTSNSPSVLQQPGEKLPSNSEMPSRFKPLTSPINPSPQVLKKIKNRDLHDRYIDQLHHREERRVLLAKKITSGVVCKTGHCDLKAARTALISDAVSFINHFRESQANPIYEFDEGELDDYYDDDDIDGDDIDE